jgi:hypothetical protein
MPVYYQSQRAITAIDLRTQPRYTMVEWAVAAPEELGTQEQPTKYPEPGPNTTSESGTRLVTNRVTEEDKMQKAGGDALAAPDESVFRHNWSVVTMTWSSPTKTSLTALKPWIHS